MAQSLRLVGGVERSPAPRPLAPRSDPQRRAKSPASDQDFARLPWANLFVLGADDVVAKLVTSFWRNLATPIVVRHRGERLRLLPTPQPVGTIIIYDVDTLTRQEQRALYHWVGAASGRTRVVSTASQSLLPMVEAGAFNDGLYYRLNVVTVDLTSPVAR